MFGGENNDFGWINSVSGNCQNCLVDANKLWRDDTQAIKKDSFISPKKTPLIYLDSLNLTQTEFIDISSIFSLIKNLKHINANVLISQKLVR